MKSIKKSRTRNNFRKRNFLVSHIQNNLIDYLIVSIIFIIGILIGIVFINNLSNGKFQETTDYINSFVSSLKNKNNIEETQVLQKSISNNLFIGILLWIFGSTIIGLIAVYFIIGFKGFCLGYTISALIVGLGTKNGIIFATTTMLLQNIIAIPCFVAIGVSGTRLYKAIMQDKRITNIKLEIVRHTIFSLFIFVLLIFSSILEAYISKNLLIYFIRYV